MDSSWSPTLFAQVSFRRENTPERTEKGSISEAVTFCFRLITTPFNVSVFHSQLFLAEPTLLSFPSKHLASIYPTPGPEAGPERNREGLFSSKTHNLPVKTEI